MKYAFLHCRIMPWWALKVLKDLIIEEKNKNPDSEIKIFTLVSESKTLKIDTVEYQVTTALPSRLNRFFLYCASKKIPILSFLFDYRNLIIFAPLLMKILSRKIKKFKFTRWGGADHIIISSFAIAKNISLSTFRPSTWWPSTTLYLHSPMQYIRSHNEEYAQRLWWLKWLLFRRITPLLRKRDKKFTTFDKIYANSKYTAKLAKEIYNLDATVKYPIANCHCEWDEAICTDTLPYYIYTGRLANFVKEVDTIIKLFNHTHDPLIIIGNGPDEIYLKSIAQKNIIFIDRIDGKKEMYTIISQAKGYINLTKESFWLSTAEALLLWVPVFGYNQWATPELVDNDSGILVDSKDIHTLITKFQEFKSKQRDRKAIATNTKKKINI